MPSMPIDSLMILIAGPYRSGTNDAPALMEEAGSKHPGDAIYDEILYPIANRLITRCDAVLRLPGASKGADEDVRLAKARGLKVFHALEEVPGCN